MNTKNRWREFGILAVIAAGFGAADAWSHRTPASCPACEFEALRAASGGENAPTHAAKHSVEDRVPAADDTTPRR